MTERDTHLDPLALVLEQDLLHRYGPMIGQDDLRQALGYSSSDAFRQALARGVLPVPVFAIAHRRGKFALAKDVAWWLAQLRHGARISALAGGGLTTDSRSVLADRMFEAMPAEAADGINVSGAVSTPGGK